MMPRMIAPTMFVPVLSRSHLYRGIPPKMAFTNLAPEEQGAVGLPKRRNARPSRAVAGESDAPERDAPARRQLASGSVDGVLHLVARVIRLVLDVALDVLEAALCPVGAAFRPQPLVVGQ